MWLPVFPGMVAAALKTRLNAVTLVTAAAAVCMALLVFSGSVFILLSSNGYLYSLAAASATPANAHLNAGSSFAAAVSAGVIGYIKGDTNDIKYASYFREEELSHLADVRRNVAVFYLFFYFLAAAAAAAFLAVFAMAKNLREALAVVSRVLFASGTAATALSMILFLLSLNFDASFTGFHMLIFGSSQWQFPSDYLLVNLFTTGFFAGFAKAAVLATFGTGIALVLASLVINRAVFKKFP